MIRSSTRHFAAFLPTTVAGETTDAATVRLSLTASASDVGPITEPTTIELFALTPSATENMQMVDAATEVFALVGSAVEVAAFADVGTESLVLTFTSDEHFCPTKVEFEGFLESRWEAERRNRWASELESRWSAQFLGIGEGFSC